MYDITRQRDGKYLAEIWANADDYYSALFDTYEAAQEWVHSILEAHGRP